MTESIVGVLMGLLAVAGSQVAARDAAIARSKAALALEISVGDNPIQLVEAVEVEWPDSSLGCPERGMIYTPVMTAGYRVTLGVGPDRFVVHATPSRAVICGRPPRGEARDAKLPPADALVGLRLAEQARADLAHRLHVGKDSVTVSFYRANLWPDAGLGCPVTGQVYSPQPTKGFLIALESGGSAYEYHSDMNRVVSCAGASKQPPDPLLSGR